MSRHTDEFGALQVFRDNEGLFPKTIQCIEAGAGSMRAALEEGMDEETDLRVVWAGTQGGDICHIICQLTVKPGGRVNSFWAKVIDGDKKEVTRNCFVSFETNRAFVRLEIPRGIFHECSVQLQTAAVNEAGVRAGGQKTVSLHDLYVGDLKVDYRIGAPVIRRAGSHDKIEISYFRGSEEEYDYVYSGRGGGKDQMYLDSFGEITVEDVLLESVDMVLSVSNSGGLEWSEYRSYPTKPEMEASCDRIKYRFESEWKGIKLTDCLGKSSYAMIDYLLQISASESGSRIITILVTNIEEIHKQLTADSIKVIPKIRAYLDCFGQGTMISMADGSRKAVEEVKAGEMVKTKDGRSALVKEVRAQDECQLLGIYLDNGETVFLTDGHAVNTVKGIYPVDRLKEGQKVIAENGTASVRRIIPKCDRRYTVYMLLLEGKEEWLYAGGVMVHSSDGAELFQDRDWVREELPEEWRTDYDNALKAGLIYGRQR